MIDDERYKARVKLAESNLASRDMTPDVQAHHPLLVVARIFRSTIERGMKKATFNERECAVSDLINEVGRMLEASGYLKLRSEREAWYHACGVEVP